MALAIHGEALVSRLLKVFPISSPAGWAKRRPAPISATRETGEGKVSEEWGEETAVSGLGIGRRGKTGCFPGRWSHRTLKKPAGHCTEKPFGVCYQSTAKS